MRQNTLSNSGNSMSNLQGTKTVPANPFAKTLASLNTESQPGPASSRSKQRASEAETSTARPYYDVDDFKRLLLKGEKNISESSPAIPPPVSFQSQHGVGDSSSNTDASSISRQSIFEPTSGPALQESPRSSHEGSPMDEERQQLVGSPPPTSGKIKPAAPKPRHGKLVKTNAPQTVSFEDPKLSFSSSTASTTLAASPTPKLPGMPSGIEKPLPVLPDALDPIQTADSANTNTETSKRNSYSATSDIQASTTPQKRNPPAPPSHEDIVSDQNLLQPQKDLRPSRKKAHRTHSHYLNLLRPQPRKSHPHLRHVALVKSEAAHHLLYLLPPQSQRYNLNLGMMILLQSLQKPDLQHRQIEVLRFLLSNDSQHSPSPDPLQWLRHHHQEEGEARVRAATAIIHLD